MKVPSRKFSLVSGLVCDPRDKTPNVVQEHLVKHPVGVTSVVTGAPWSAERWDELGVIDEATRRTFIQQVLRLRHGHAECAVPEIRGSGATASLDTLACKSCPSALASTCEAVSSATIAARYFAVFEQLLDAVSGPTAESMPKATLTTHLFGALRSTPSLADVVVAYGGLDARSRTSLIVRLNRGDGVRAEVWFEEPDQLSWRTLYRDPRAVATPNGRISFLMDAPPQANSRTRLSDFCLVSRPFYKPA